MKKTIILCFLLAGGSRLNAQSLFQAKPSDSLTNNLDKYLKINPGDKIRVLVPQFNIAEQLAALNDVNSVKRGNIDHMPIAFLDGYSKMPVVKLGGYYTMPILRTGSLEILPLQKETFPLLSPKPLPAVQSGH